MARPTKIHRFVEVAQDVLFRENIILLTDEELVFMINEELEESERVAQRTFESWKAGEIKDANSIEFLRVMKRALITQKQNLFDKFKTDDKAWTRWAWIIERKFSEWNLKHISENKNDNNNKSTINIQMSKGDVDDLDNILGE